MAGRVNEILEETADKWDIFFVEKEKQDLKRPNTFKVYQKEKDKGKGKLSGPPSIKVIDNLPSPSSNTPPETESMETTHEDTNPDSEVLYIMNIDTQEVNIVVDKESSEKRDVATEPPVEDTSVETNVKDTVGDIEIGSEQQTKETTDIGKADRTSVHNDVSTEQPTTNSNEKSVETLTIDISGVSTEKSVVNIESQIEKLAVDTTEK